MEAGSDTTSSTLLNFILALAKYPRVLERAHEELDQICGTERSPTVEDIHKLPYISACVNEVRNTALSRPYIWFFLFLFFFPITKVVFAGPAMEAYSSWWDPARSYPRRQLRGIRYPQGDNTFRKYVVDSSK